MSRIGPMVAALLTAVGFIVAPARAATANTSAGGFACEVTYQAYPYPGGFIAELIVRNTGMVTLYGWTLRFPLDEEAEIIEMWDAELTSPSGLIIAHNTSYNGVVEPGRSVGVGFWASGTARPSSTFTVNGVNCALAG